MKFLIIFALICIAVARVESDLTSEQKGKLRELYRRCVSESRVDENLIVQARRKNFAENNALKAYYHCMFRNLKFQNDDGSFNTDAIFNKLPIEERHGLEGTITTCAEQARFERTPQDKSFSAMKCFIENTKEEISFN